MADNSKNTKIMRQADSKKLTEHAQTFDLHLCIGVFFDGRCEPCLSDASGHDSRAPSHVRKLHQWYEQSDALTGRGQQKSTRLKLYIPADTLLNEGDDTGTEAQIREVFKRIRRLLDTLQELHPHAEIGSILFDTFGFGCGTGAARFFASTVKNRSNDLWSYVLSTSKAKFSRQFIPHSDDVDVRFVGLFDAEKKPSEQNFNEAAPAHQKGYVTLPARRRATDGLSQVYLHMMYALAKASDVPFKDIDPNDPDYGSAQALQALCDKFK